MSAPHGRALVVLFERYRIAVPADPYAGTIVAPDTVQLACQAGVTGELENIALYDELLPGIGEAEVLEVFTPLRAASLERHLPAFERCS